MPALMQEFFEKTAAAEAVRQRECAAALTLQRITRGFLLRKRLRFLRAVAIVIQKRWRGYKGRARFKEALHEFDRRQRVAYFERAATMIQKMWRGYYGRTYVHNFYARRIWLENIKIKNQQTRRELQVAFHEAVQNLQDHADQMAQKSFAHRLHKLAHLASIEVKPGGW